MPATEPDDDAAPVRTPSEGARRRVSVRALLLLAVVGAVVYGLDQLTKTLVVAGMQEEQKIPLLGPVLQLHYVTNSGAAFSFANGYTWAFSIVAAGVIVAIIWFARRIRSLAWATMFGLVLGGALGNLTDRLFRPPGFGVGHVVDFISIGLFPAIFNVADMAITFSMALFILLSLRGTGLDGSKAVIRKPVPAAAAEDEPTQDGPGGPRG
ncbi:signal peptidase II [Pseudolysinimonas sp.]|uniref:signal peptidase II n=1 Tax=Pseudolysinimonas sp. TaxID=2680009 RepID=UPI003F800E6F